MILDNKTGNVESEHVVSPGIDDNADVSAESGNNDNGHCSSRQYQSGIVAIWSDDGKVQRFADTVLHYVDAIDACCVFTFFSADHYATEDLTSALAELPDAVSLVGCSSSGEVTPDGLVDGSAVAILLPRNHFTVCSTVLENINTLGIDDIESRAAELKNRFAKHLGSDDMADVFAVNLIDGLSFSEESVTAALHRALVDVPLIGGSAGDNLQFDNTTQIHNGKHYNCSAILVMVHSRVPFRVFTNNNFVPTEHKLVVTESNIDKRVVREFNAEPAAIAYARAVGLDPDNLNPTSFASHPVVVKVGGEYYCRSIRKCENDHSLAFFCAIDNGIVLTIAEPTGMVQSTRKAIEALRDSLGGIDMILGFDCILRRLDAANRGGMQNISKLYVDANVIGFGTYGEQFNSMHINQTFTGIAFGAPA